MSPHRKWCFLQFWSETSRKRNTDACCLALQLKDRSVNYCDTLLINVAWLNTSNERQHEGQGWCEHVASCQRPVSFTPKPLVSTASTSNVTFSQLRAQHGTFVLLREWTRPSLSLLLLKFYFLQRQKFELPSLSFFCVDTMTHSNIEKRKTVSLSRLLFNLSVCQRFFFFESNLG